MRTSIAACFLIAFVCSEPILAQPAKRAITIDDYFTQADLFEVAFSANDVVYTEGRWQESTDDRKTDLWIAPRSVARPGKGQPVVQVSTHRRLTSDRAAD